jgi:protein pelota
VKLLEEDKKKGLVSLLIEGSEDLWYLDKVIGKGDKVAGRSYRAVKIGEKEEKKPVFIKIEVEKKEFREKPLSLRLTGKILEGKPEEFVQIGRYHSLDLNEKQRISIEKELQPYEIELLREALKKSRQKLATLILSDEKHFIVIDIGHFGYGVKYEEELPSSKRLSQKEITTEKNKIYTKLAESLSKEAYILIAGPGFEKEHLATFLKERGFTVKTFDVGYAEISAVKELFDKGLIDKVIGEARIDREAKLVDEFLKHVYKDDKLAVYGLKDVEKAKEMGAIKDLLVLDSLLTKEEVREFLKSIKDSAKVHIISASHEWGKMLKGLGGIGAILHFSIE